MFNKRGELIFYIILFLSLIMVNPPVLNLVNDYAKQTPLMWGYPTLWLWLELWFAVAILDFLFAVLFIKSWKKDY